VELDADGNALVLLPRDLNITRNVSEDIRLVQWGLRNTSKRRAAPSWSVPNELLIFSLDPSYCSVGEYATTGIGYQRLAALEEEKYYTCKSELYEFLVHLHRCRLVPMVANRSAAFLQPKANGLSGILGQRILHVYCSFWKQFYGTRLKQCMKKNRELEWDSFANAYLSGRRREGAIAVQTTVQEKLGVLGLSSIAHLRDMSNAFASTTDEARQATLAELVPAAREHDLGYRAFFKQKLVSSAVTFEADDGEEVTVLPMLGNIVGSSEGPVLFSHAYNKHIKHWLFLRQLGAPCPTITLMHPNGSVHEGAVVVFADDSLTRRVLEPGETLEAAAVGLAKDDGIFDIAMGAGGWKQNRSKADVVPAVKKKSCTTGLRAGCLNRPSNCCVWAKDNTMGETSGGFDVLQWVCPQRNEEESSSHAIWMGIPWQFLDSKGEKVGEEVVFHCLCC
jgi:hypothetical protein